ncbi:MAG: signal recognition particle-docking protein FtsY [Alphaproteobacteria bacterium]|nr:signal recognition particle-docking protein FtsY [Alphaproteobacteria bacterium]
MGFFDRFKSRKDKPTKGEVAPDAPRDDKVSPPAAEQLPEKEFSEKASVEKAPAKKAPAKKATADSGPEDKPSEEGSSKDDAYQDDAYVGATAPEDIEAEDAPGEKPKKSWFGRLKDGLGKSAQKITTSLADAIGKPKLDASDLDDIEDALIMADLGVAAAGRLTAGLKKRPFPDGVTADTLAEALAEEVTEILAPVAKPIVINPALKPHVVLMVGVNGSGKTTTTGKLAEQWQAEGKTVMLAAADTFRAAAVEQLKVWGERTGTTVISGEAGSDAAAVAYQAYETAIEQGADVLIVDTAGRLQAKAELMDELAKICRVLAKKDERAPHDRIIVLDGTVGQNASSQVSAFTETADLSGMIITKLDGSARGGVVVALAEAFKLPIHAVGVGEGKDDLRAFDAEDFGRALAGLGPKS